MTLLVIGLLLFFIPHLSRETGLRQKLIDVLPGHRDAYRAIHALSSLAGLALIIIGKAAAPFIMVWQPLLELHLVNRGLMGPVFLLFFAGVAPPNFTHKLFRNPMLLSVVLWGLAHLWSNGDLASIILFGSFTLWAGFKFITLSRKPPSFSKEPLLRWDFVILIAGLIAYQLVLRYHGQIFGVVVPYV